MNVLPVFKKIKTFVLDVDGVLTDSSIILLNDGHFARRMNIKDGYALQLAIKKGYRILEITFLILVFTSELTGVLTLSRQGLRES